MLYIRCLTYSKESPVIHRTLTFCEMCYTSDVWRIRRKALWYIAHNIMFNMSYVWGVTFAKNALGYTARNVMWDVWYIWYIMTHYITSHIIHLTLHYITLHYITLHVRCVTWDVLYIWYIMCGIFNIRIRKRALCIRKRALCIWKRALCIRKRALCIWKSSLVELLRKCWDCLQMCRALLRI